MDTLRRNADTANQQSVHYLWIQDFLTMMTGMLWGTAYLLYIRQAYKDHSYGLPLLTLCGMVGWDVIYGLFYPPATTEYISNILCPLLDFGLIYSTVKFGQNEWIQSPLVQQNLPLLIFFGCGFMTLANWSFLALFIPDIYQAIFWSALVTQNFISWGAISQLLVRASTRGHTLTIWTTRFLATLCAIVSYYWRAYHYPKEWDYIYAPAAVFVVVAAEIGDIAYPFIFLYIRKRENKEKQA